jgi:hypothetical protein
MIERLKTLNGVLLLAAANSLLWSVVAIAFPNFASGETVWLAPVALIRDALTFYVGWVVLFWNKGSLWRAAFAGALVFLVDHPVVRGTIFLLQGEVTAFWGVLISYVMFFWLSMLFAVVGALVAKAYLARHHA